MKNKRNVAKQTYYLETEIPQKLISNIKQIGATRFQQQHKISDSKTTQLSSEYPQEIHNDCLSCGIDITHPLCPNCISKAFHVWTKKFPEHKILKSKLNVLMKHHNHSEKNSKSCVACQNPVHICPLCFTKHLHSLIKEAGLGVRAMTEFLFIFNFDFNHNEYFQELETYGGY